MVGKSISHYKILEKLGEGGMGVVYKAQDTKLDRFVALKFLPPYLSMDDEAKLRFVHEAKAASALDHANICTIYEISETEDGQTFIAMAYYDGETIKAKIARGPLPVSEALDYAVQAALGLSKAHAEGIIHRDIKPANIMVTRDGVVKIVDFGLAKMASQTQLTKAGTTLGTVSYMSPEQTQGEEVDARTDVWSLGVVLYELLTGKPPFRGDYEAAVIYSILHEAPEPISAVRPDVPEELAQVVLQCLDQDRDNRFESAEALIAALPGGTSPIILTEGPPPSTTKTLAIFGVAAIIGSGAVYAAMMMLGLPGGSCAATGRFPARAAEFDVREKTGRDEDQRAGRTIRPSEVAHHAASRPRWRASDVFLRGRYGRLHDLESPRDWGLRDAADGGYSAGG